MACRTPKQEAAAGLYNNSSAQRETVHKFNYRTPETRASHLTGSYDSAQTGTVLGQYKYGRWPEPSAPPVPDWQGAAVASLLETGQAAAHIFNMADEGGNVQQVNIIVNNPQVNIVHQHVNGSQGMPIIEDGAVEAQALQTQEPHFQANDPDFHPCTYSPQGLDFGYKSVSLLYRARKHVHSQHNMITYTQCASFVQHLSHGLTLHTSHKRTKHAIFLFDGRGLVDKLASAWPSEIKFIQMKSLIGKLGPHCEYHREKVKKDRFSLYLYVVKCTGVQFSEQGRKSWSGLFQWAHSLENSSHEKMESYLSGFEVIAQVAGIGLGIAGVV